jgi:hypothetical protein
MMMFFACCGPFSLMEIDDTSANANDYHPFSLMQADFYPFHPGQAILLSRAVAKKKAFCFSTTFAGRPMHTREESSSFAWSP